MSPELAALCHHAGATAPDCCKKERSAPSRRAPESAAAPELSSTPATRTVAELAAGASNDVTGGARELARAAVCHELGLYTLHSVFRI